MRYTELLEAPVLPNNFPWRMPLEFREIIMSWPVRIKSPHSHSYYDVEEGQKTWEHTPVGSHRISDHWNFVNPKFGNMVHCPTDDGKPHGWALGRWDGEKYVILMRRASRKLHELTADEARRAGKAKQYAKAIHDHQAIQARKQGLTEAAQMTHIVYHGSEFPNIQQFRTEGLRNRTGTPGTLSFTESIETAKIYGSHIYKVEVAGRFGDYRNPADCEAVFEWRKARALRDGYFTKTFGDDQSKWEGLWERKRREITEGYYAQWENKHMWNELGWQGAWCFESGSNNLIIGYAECVKRIVEVTNEGLADKVRAFAERIKTKYELWHFNLTPKGKTIRLDMIATKFTDREHGTGTKVMQELCEFADAYDMTIILTPNYHDEGFGTTSHARLVKFYKRFGFYENKGRKIDHAISDTMIREPRDLF